MLYTLPCCPTIRRQDRFDDVGADDAELPFWQILEAILVPAATSCAELIDQLQTIAVTLHDTTGECDYQFLENFMRTSQWTATFEQEESLFFTCIWRRIVNLALEMPTLFPENSVPALSAQHHRQVRLSRRQVACLVIHQFLGSLPARPWQTESCLDFSIWYSSNVRHPGAVKAYLTAMFTYFERITTAGDDDEDNAYPIIFTLRSSADDGHLRSENAFEEAVFVPMKVSHEPVATTSPAFLGSPDEACVISANKSIGFGATGTQEEMQVGSAPECYPAVLLAPPLRDMEVLTVQGADAMVSLKGHGREAHLDKTLAKDQSGLHWERRTMLFMDALELDLYDPQWGVPDLLYENVSREFTKAYTAFSSRGDYGYSRIVTGLWGCGAFGGNREIKSLIQWCAASMAGVPLHFFCAGPDQLDFAARLTEVVENGTASAWRVKDVLGSLRKLTPHDPSAGDAFSYIMEAQGPYDDERSRS